MGYPADNDQSTDLTRASEEPSSWTGIKQGYGWATQKHLRTDQKDRGPATASCLGPKLDLLLQQLHS
ncbi:Cdk5 Regulatory Subunit-Associated Protein 3 [Manis pentadactyla]|nr:Cdk5 Regulatory Subunit-Associated Protein 3 [Manis pentadactyla]